VIIGGGIIGCSIAFNLAKLGAKNIILLEKEPILGAGSTAKCSGGIRQQFISPANIRLSIESVKIFKNWQEEFPYPPEYQLDFRQTGYLFLLHSEKETADFQKRVALQRELGIRDIGFLNLHDISIALPYLNLDDIIAGVFCASDGVADPASVRAEYERQARMLGVQIFTDVKVFDIGANIGYSPKRIEIIFTNQGPILTRCVINAAGPFANQIGKMLGIEIPVIPHRHQTIVTPPLKWVGKNDPLVVDNFEGQGFYFRPEAGDEETGYQLLLGGHENNKIQTTDPDKYNEKIDQDFILYLAERAINRFKKNEEIQIIPKTGLAGLYESTPDALPILGKTAEIEGLILANGFSGHGFMHSPIVGKIIAEIALFGQSSFDITGLGLDDFKANARAPAENAII
ncbi:MAG: FAD-binding oxidoreductase, partial [bacterium]|nr:FAD-binding oxidoreductase [bacterium]